MNNYAVILAAGIGSRLLPITDEMPKSLVKVSGRAIIDYQIRGYLHSGVPEENIIVVTGYMSEKIENFLKIYYPQVQVLKSPDYRSTNNMYSLYLALSFLYKTIGLRLDTLFINNADCLYDESLMKEFAICRFENAIATEMGSYLEESMKIVCSKDGYIQDISKKIFPNDAAGVSVDLYKYSARTVLKLWEIVKDFIEVKKDLKQWTEVAFPELFKTEKVYPFDIMHKKWVEVDNLDDLLLADRLFSDFDFRKIKAWICDLDGTLFVGNTPIQSAVNFVLKNQNCADFYYLTNNTSKTPQDYVQKLSNAGLKVSENQIATPLYTLIDYIKTQGLKSVYLMANDKVTSFLKRHLPNVQLDFDFEQNEAVVLTYDTEMTYEKMKNASVLLHNRHVLYIATHQDIFCPYEQGPIPDIGSFIMLMKAVTAFEPSIILGKPSVHLIDKYLKHYGAKNVAIVGDRLYTDKKLADNAQCSFVCVLSGETTRLDVAKDEGRAPAIVLKTLGDLSEISSPPPHTQEKNEIDFFLFNKASLVFTCELSFSSFETKFNSLLYRERISEPSSAFYCS